MKINSINNQYNQNRQSNTTKNNQTNPSFKGSVPKPIVNGLSKFYENVANNGAFQKGIKSFSHSNNTFTHLLVMESCILSGFYMINTLRNKKIKKEQKPQMLINDTLTLGLSTAGAYLAEDKISAAVNKGAEKYFTKNKDFYVELGKKAQEKAGQTPLSDLLSKAAETVGKTGTELKTGLEETTGLIGSHLKNIVGSEGKLKAYQITEEKLAEVQGAVADTIKNAKVADEAKEKVKQLTSDLYNSSAARTQADKVMPGINKLKVLVIFGIVYRYIGPVVFTPIANKLSSKFFPEKKEESKPNTDNSKSTDKKTEKK